MAGFKSMRFPLSYASQGCYANTRPSGQKAKGKISQFCEDRFTAFPIKPNYDAKKGAASICAQSERHYKKNIYSPKFKTGSQSGTTFLQVAVQDKVVTASWLGDSPAYLLRQKKNGELSIEKITREHNHSMLRLYDDLTTRRHKPVSSERACQLIQENFTHLGRGRFSVYTDPDHVKTCVDAKRDTRGRIDTGTNMFGSLGDGKSTLKRVRPEHNAIDLGLEKDTEKAWVIAASDGVSDMLDKEGVLPENPNVEYLLDKASYIAQLFKVHKAMGQEVAFEKVLAEKLTARAHKKWLSRSASSAYVDDITIAVSDVASNRLMRVFDGHGGYKMAQHAYELSLLEFADQWPAIDQEAMRYRALGGYKKGNITQKDYYLALYQVEGFDVQNQERYPGALSFKDLHCFLEFRQMPASYIFATNEHDKLFGAAAARDQQRDDAALCSQLVAECLQENVALSLVPAKLGSPERIAINKQIGRRRGFASASRNLYSYIDLIDITVKLPKLKLATGVHQALVAHQDQGKGFFARFFSGIRRFFMGDYYTKSLFQRMSQTQEDLDRYALDQEGVRLTSLLKQHDDASLAQLAKKENKVKNNIDTYRMWCLHGGFDDASSCDRESPPYCAM